MGSQKVPPENDSPTTQYVQFFPQVHHTTVQGLLALGDKSTRTKKSEVSNPSTRSSRTTEFNVARSASLPTTFRIASYILAGGDMPALQRSSSTLPIIVQIDQTIQTCHRETAALNGVSLYYSSRSRVSCMDHDGEGLVQLTHSQRIKRSSSFGVSGFNSARLNSPKRFHTVKDKRLLVAELAKVPFISLFRSSSLESPCFYQSIQLLQATKSSIRKKAGARHQFHRGKVSLNGRASLMRRAYPGVHCDYCRRLFEGSDRKLKLARHRRKVHACVIPSSTGIRKHVDKSWQSDGL